MLMNPFFIQYIFIHRGKSTTMNIGLLKFICVVSATFHLNVCKEEIGCIQQAADFYSTMTNGSTCFSNLSLDMYENTSKSCSQVCSVQYSSRKDNYIRLRIKYAADIILKLDNKKKNDCNYTQKDIIIDCSIEEIYLGSLTSCIINQCLNAENVNHDGTNLTEPRHSIRDESTFYLIFLASVIGGLLLGTIFTSLICLKTRHTICLQGKGMGHDRYSLSLIRTFQERTDGADPQKSESVFEDTKMVVYEDVQEGSVYSHLHEGLKTTTTHYSTMKNLFPEDYAKSEISKDKGHILLNKNKDNDNLNKRVQANSSENSFDKMNMSKETELTGEYFTLEKINN